MCECASERGCPFFHLFLYGVASSKVRYVHYLGRSHPSQNCTILALCLQTLQLLCLHIALSGPCSRDRLQPSDPVHIITKKNIKQTQKHTHQKQKKEEEKNIKNLYVTLQEQYITAKYVERRYSASTVPAVRGNVQTALWEAVEGGSIKYDNHSGQSTCFHAWHCCIHVLSYDLALHNS